MYTLTVPITVCVSLCPSVCDDDRMYKCDVEVKSSRGQDLLSSDLNCNIQMGAMMRDAVRLMYGD